MNGIERIPAPERCPMCGGERQGPDVDGRPERSGAETIRKLAAIADESPSLALLLIHTIAGRSQADIARKLRMSPSSVCERIKQVRAKIASL